MWTLLHYPLCPASRAIRLALNEAGIEAALSEVRPWEASREFLNLNPAGTLPVLAFEGKAICGTYPVIEYLAEIGCARRPRAGPVGLLAGKPHRAGGGAPGGRMVLAQIRCGSEPISA